MLKNCSADRLKYWIRKFGNNEIMTYWLEWARNSLKWQKMAGEGLKWPWYVLFWPLVLNMTGFDDDEYDESNQWPI